MFFLTRNTNQVNFLERGIFIENEKKKIAKKKQNKIMLQSQSNLNIQGASNIFGQQGSVTKGQGLDVLLGPAFRVLTDSQSGQPVENYNIYEALKDQEIQLGNLFTNLILIDSEKIVTEVIPWLQVNSNAFTWNLFEYTDSLIGPVPPEGISRLTTISKQQRKASIIRKGRALMAEVDNMKTPSGQQEFLLGIASIKNTVILSQSYDTVVMLQNCKNNEQRWADIYKMFPVSISTLFDYEARNFGLVAKDEFGLDSTIAWGKKVMSRLGVTPDSLIVPKGTSAYVHLVANGKERGKYYVGGPEGVNLQQRGGDTVEIQGLKLYEVDSIDVNPETGPVNPLEKSIRVGEVYQMGLETLGVSDLAGFKTNWLDTYIYDFNRDDDVRIDFKDSFNQAKIFADGDKDWSNMVYTEIRKMNEQDTDEQRSQWYKEQEEMWGLSSSSMSKRKYMPKQARPPFFATRDHDGKWTAVDYFGKMGVHAMSPDDLTNICKTVVQRISFDGGYTGLMSAWDDALDLIEELENAPYNADFAVGIVEANIDRSKIDGNFVGSISPLNPSGNLREWTPNVYGGLDLPYWPANYETTQFVFPFGFANGPGLLTLTSHADNENSYWRGLGNRARNAVFVFKAILSVLMDVFNMSSVCDPNNRAPWFHQPNPFTVFFSEVISVNRDPIFITVPQTTTVAAVKKPSEKAETSEFPAEVGVGIENFDITEMESDFLRDVEKGNFEKILNDFKTETYALKNRLKTPMARLYYSVTNLDAATAKLYAYMVNEMFAHAEKNITFPSIFKLASIIWSYPMRCIGTATYNARLITVSKMTFALSRENMKDRLSLIDKLYNLLGGDEKEQKVANITLKNLLRQKSVKDHEAKFDDKNLLELRNFVLQISPEGKEQVVKLPKIPEKAEAKPQETFDLKQWFRSPLTMSRGLLYSLSTVTDSIISPADSTVGFVQPIFREISLEKKLSLPQQTLDRIQYKDLREIYAKGWKRVSDLLCVSKFLQVPKRVLPKLTEEQKRDAKRRRYKKMRLAKRSKQEKPQSIFETEELEEEEEMEEEEEKVSLEIVSPEEAELMLYSGLQEKYESYCETIFSKRYDNVQRTFDNVCRCIAVAFMFTPCKSKSQWDRMLNKDILVPVNLLLWRLNIDMTMANFIMLKRGNQTGINAYGYVDVKTALDAHNKTIYYNLTFHSRPIIMDPRNVFQLMHVMPRNYNGGGNTQYIANKSEMDNNMRDRPSLIVTANAITENLADMPKWLSFCGLFPVALNMAIDGGMQRQWSSCNYYDNIWKFYKECQFDLGKRGLTMDPASINVVAAQGLQYVYDPACKSYSKKISSQSHIGDTGSAHGAIRTWDGVDIFFGKH